MKMPLQSLLVLLFIIATPRAFSQVTPVSDPSSSKIDSLPGDDGDPFTAVEVEAAFPGGTDAWIRFLQKNLKAEIPVDRGAKAGYYTVIVQFVVDKEGNLSAFKPLTNHGFGMEAEVLRVLQKSPKWVPAVQFGRNVKAYRKQPVTFAVIEEEKKGKKKNKD